MPAVPVAQGEKERQGIDNHYAGWPGIRFAKRL